MVLFVSLSPHLEVLNTLQQSMSLFLSVLPLVSSRVLSTHPNQKRHPALEDMQKNCKRMLLLRRENASLLEGQVSTFIAFISFCYSFFFPFYISQSFKIVRSHRRGVGGMRQLSAADTVPASAFKRQQYHL